jgi:heme/copper-type cytochrome/quinol oxidase subunit 2
MSEATAAAASAAPTTPRAKPVFLMMICGLNGIQLLISAIFAGLFFHGNQCTNAQGEAAAGVHNYAAFGVVFCVAFLFNLLFGLFVFRRIRYRSRKLSVAQQLRKLVTAWPSIVYLILLLFEVIWAIVVVSIVPKDDFCRVRESGLMGLAVALGYLLIVAVIGFFVALVINMVFGCGRKFDDEASEDEEGNPVVSKQPKKATTPAAAATASAPVDAETNPFSDEPSAPPLAVEDAPQPQLDDNDAPPPPAAPKKKAKKKTEEELADDAWNQKVREETGAN